MTPSRHAAHVGRANSRRRTPRVRRDPRGRGGPRDRIRRVHPVAAARRRSRGWRCRPGAGRRPLPPELRELPRAGGSGRRGRAAAAHGRRGGRRLLPAHGPDAARCARPGAAAPGSAFRPRGDRGPRGVRREPRRRPRNPAGDGGWRPSSRLGAVHGQLRGLPRREWHAATRWVAGSLRQTSTRRSRSTSRKR